MHEALVALTSAVSAFDLSAVIFLLSVGHSETPAVGTVQMWAVIPLGEDRLDAVALLLEAVALLLKVLPATADKPSCLYRDAAASTI